MSGSFCRSLYAYNGDQHQQGLKFEAGELIKITQALDGGWWEGEKDGEKGWFPSTYVQMEVSVIIKHSNCVNKFTNHVILIISRCSVYL